MSFISKLTKLILRAFSKPSAHIACILLFGVLAYANTFNVPFLFDDNRAILDNHLIKNIGNLWPPAGTRWFGLLTFALNYAVGGLQVTGYHCVNLAIHLAASLLVYQLVVIIFRTPLFRTDKQSAICEQAVPLTAFVTAFLFVSHPVQTQAVTYIVQRFASLATLLFLASMVCYIQARLSYVCGNNLTSNRWKGTIAWYVAAVLWAVLAMKTKEIALTLPFVIVIFEFAFFIGRPLTERFYFLVPVVLTLFIIPFALLDTGSEGISVLSQPSDISRHDYFLTQFRVIVTYLRLLILPVNQMIDYNYPIYREVSDPSVYLSFFLLSVLFLASVLLLFRGGRGKVSPEWRIVGLGGAWFFITLSVESSIIPITDVIFEHRLYLPAAGVFMAVATTVQVAVGRLGTRFPRSAGGMSAIIACILVSLPVATHFRNRVWHSVDSLWEDVARKSPGNARAQVILGVSLVGSGKIDQAIAHFQEAIRIKPDYVGAFICLGTAYMDKGMPDEGYQQYLKALVLRKMDFESRAQLMMNIGNYNRQKHQPDRAIYYYKNALSITPNDANIHYNLGLVYKEIGNSSEAAEEFTRARQLNPDRY